MNILKWLGFGDVKLPDIGLMPKKYKWPDCSPPAGGIYICGMSDGHREYMKKEVEPDHWQWVINEEAERQIAESQQKQTDLWWALRTRPLSDEEMAEVKNYGAWLNLFTNETYRQEEKTKELNDALARQWEMQAKALKMAQK